ncbi:hypothetical protein B0F90DRAFT_1727700, partial [Multifurca ochricompacta]
MCQEYLSGRIIITGDPGLGKTCFLLYLLFYHLSKGLSTALQILPDSFVLFTDSGAEVYAHTFGRLPDETWALADSNVENPLSCHSFLRACRKHYAFIVQTSYPDVRRYKTWKKEYNAYGYVMDCFPLTESIALGIINGFDVQLIKDHCEKWGPSVRIMMALMTNPDQIPDHLRCVKTAAVDFADDFGKYKNNINAMAVSHTVFTIRPESLSIKDRPSAIG